MATHLTLTSYHNGHQGKIRISPDGITLSIQYNGQKGFSTHGNPKSLSEAKRLFSKAILCNYQTDWVNSRVVPLPSHLCSPTTPSSSSSYSI